MTPCPRESIAHSYAKHGNAQQGKPILVLTSCVVPAANDPVLPYYLLSKLAYLGVDP